MRINVKVLVLFLLLTLGLYSCTSSKKTQTVAGDPTTEEYYSKLGSNIERLQQLKSGYFVQYREWLQIDTIIPWKVNEGRDSMILYISPVGTSSKDGYWLYYHQFLSNLPDAPVYTAYEKLEMVNRDTFKGTFYEAPTKFEWEKIINKDKSVTSPVFSQLKATGEEVFYVRKNQHSFEGFSVIYKNVVKTKTHREYRQDLYAYSPTGFTIDIYFYADTQGNDKERSSVVEHLDRRKAETLPASLKK